jgi:hypothetical protein
MPKIAIAQRHEENWQKKKDKILHKDILLRKSLPTQQKSIEKKVPQTVFFTQQEMAMLATNRRLPPRHEIQFFSSNQIKLPLSSLLLLAPALMLCALSGMLPLAEASQMEDVNRKNKHTAQEFSNEGEFDRTYDSPRNRDPKALWAPQIKRLPNECENLQVIRGNPTAAKTIIFGEVHYNAPCYNSIMKCMERLSKGIPKSDVVVLLENIPHDGETTCFLNEWQRPGILNITDNCRGWNQPFKIYKPILDMAVKQKSLLQACKIWRLALIENKIIDEADQLIDKSNKKTQSFKRMLMKVLEYVLQSIESGKRIEQAQFENYKKYHPQVTREKFTSRYTTTITEDQHVVEHIASALKKIDQGMFLWEIYNMMYEERSTAYEKFATYINDLNASIKMPNNYLFKSINELFKNYEKVFAIAGGDHVTKRKFFNFQQQPKIVQALYDQFDSVANENPYVILSCKY